MNPIVLCRLSLLPGFLLLGSLLCAQPVLTNLQPRGAQKGRPFILTIAGRNLTEGAKIWSTLPATFTPLGSDSTTFLVEPTRDIPVGTYPIRLETPEGISNIQLLTIGAFPEYTEDESKPGALPNSNDTVETAQPLPSAPFVMNGALKGPERDIYRLSAKAGEKRVIEVEARRCGSAIDPVIEVLDVSGKPLARGEDVPLIGLDARTEVTFPRDGFYYIVVHDARYSTQTANFYRLKVGSYDYATELFPLGGKRGEAVTVSLGAHKISADLTHLDPTAKLTFVNLPEPAGLPIPFAIGDDPEVTEPVAKPLAAPVTINGRISQPGELDRYQIHVTPGEALIFRMQAVDLGTSKLMAVMTVLDEKGKQLARSGDEPLAEDVYNVNSSRTASDPILRVQAPEGASTLTVTIEDLALRGGPNYGYRLNVQKLAHDFRLVLNTPYVNIPAGGSAMVPVTVQRQGYDGEVQLRIPNAPKGLKVEGGFVIAASPVKETPQNRSSRGVLVLTAEAGTKLAATELRIEGVAKLPDGSEIFRTSEGPGMTVNIAGATEQGSVDRQRPLTAPWLNLQLPVATTKAQPAALEVSMLERKRQAEGDEILFRWKWRAEDRSLPYPKSVNADMVGAGDIRVIEVKLDPKDSSTGTFVITTTKLTRPSKYDLYVTGRLRVDGQDHDIVSRPITVEVQEVKPTNAETASSR